MLKVRATVAAVCVIALAAVGGCARKEPEVSTAPTAANPKPYPGMENVKGRGTLRIPRDQAPEGK